MADPLTSPGEILDLLGAIYANDADKTYELAARGGPALTLALGKLFVGTATEYGVDFPQWLRSMRASITAIHN